MIQLFLLKYWKYLLSIFLIFTVGLLVYNKIYSMGYNSATTKYEQKIKNYEIQLNNRIAIIEYNSGLLVKQGEANKLAVRQDISKILTSLKDRPVFVIKDGKCSLSDDFIDVYNKAIERANKK